MSVSGPDYFTSDRQRLADATRRADDAESRAERAEGLLDEAVGACRYIAQPTMGLPGGEWTDADIDTFIRQSATEANVRNALAACVHIARAFLASLDGTKPKEEA